MVRGRPHNKAHLFLLFHVATDQRYVGFYILKTSQCSAAEDEVLVVQFSSPIIVL